MEVNPNNYISILKAREAKKNKISQPQMRANRIDFKIIKCTFRFP